MRALRAACAIAASAAAYALYSRVEWPWFALGWIGFVPWLAVLDRTRSAAGALAAGVAMSVAFVLAVFWWFGGAIASYSGVPTFVGFAVLVLVAPLLQPQLVVFPLVRRFARARAPFWRSAAIGACAYVGVEWAWTKLFGDTIGHGFFASRLLRQSADLAGAAGLTFVLVVANECLWETAKRAAALRPAGGVRAARGLRAASNRRTAASALAPAAAVAAIVAAMGAYGAVRVRQLAAAERGAPRIKAALVQANIGNYDRMRAQLGTYETVRAILDEHIALSAPAVTGGDVDLLVWPETVYPTTFAEPKSFEGMAFDREIALTIAQWQTPFVFGTYDTDGAQEYNAAVLIDPDEDKSLESATYRKSRLFLFTERVPAFLDSAALRARFPWLGTWKEGAGGDVFAVTLRDGRTVHAAPLICLDAVDPSLTLRAVEGGADVIVTISHDGWFSTGDQGPRLHLVVSAFRSLESRRPQLRATNTGVSAVITPAGDLLATAGVGERTTLVAEVVPAAAGTATLMTMWGDWFGSSALVAGAILLLSSLRRSSRRYG